MKKSNIQVCRIVACLFVWGVHIGQLFGYSGLIRKVLDLGVYAPHMFFIICGFVAFYSNANRQHFTAKKYYLNRFFRIMPLYYLVIFFYYVVHNFFWKDIPIDESGLRWFRYIFVLNRIIPENDEFWCNLGATWTISCLLLFYILFPILKLWINNIYKAVGVWLFCIMLCKITIKGISLEPIYYLHYFMLGVVLYYAVVNGKENVTLTLLLVGILLLLILKREAINYILCLLFGAIILSTNGLQLKGKKSNKIVGLLDQYSYTIYLCHPVIHELCEQAVLPKNLLVVVLSVLIMCVVIHELYEKPIDKLYRELCCSK